jgi:hypothetical protein
MSHTNRTSFCLIGPEGVIDEPPDLLGRCPHLTPTTKPQQIPQLKFGRMFCKAPDLKPFEREQMIIMLTRLGQAMNQSGAGLKDSVIPAGYTYLGQFLAHEITFDRTSGIPSSEPIPINWRTPQIDLDSVYGWGPGDQRSQHMYEDDRATLIVGETTKNPFLNKRFPNDLFRDQEGNAQIEDERNDENLPLAQTHVAIVRFHNAVLENLKGKFPPEQLFELARQEVRRHMQWIILTDYLPRIVDKKVLECVLTHGLRWFRVSNETDLFMPLEFSAAAFRLGHSMVRARYEWNKYHASPPELRGPAVLSQLFDQTKFSGNLSGEPTLLSEWVIDWRRFYSFEGMTYPQAPINFSRPINTTFELHLETIAGYPHEPLAPDKRAIPVRNLLRGFAVGLPTGEDVAEWIGVTPLTRKQIATGPHEDVLDIPIFWGKTPLWYYVLKEAELFAGGNHLGPVGSRIVAETLIGILMYSPDSILANPEWRPVYSDRKTESNAVRFEMADLLDFADVVNPVGILSP